MSRRKSLRVVDDGGRPAVMEDPVCGGVEKFSSRAHRRMFTLLRAVRANSLSGRRDEAGQGQRGTAGSDDSKEGAP